MTDLGKVCPECGVKLEGLDIVAHALTHWPDYIDPAKGSKVAIKRQKQLLDGGVTPDEFKKAHSEV